MSVDTPSYSTDFLLTVEGLTVSFDGFKAVDNLTFYVDTDEIRVMTGPNGAGKTTVLDLICGRNRATSGSASRTRNSSRHAKTRSFTRASGESSRIPRSMKISRCSRTSNSYPSGYTMFGALASKRSAEVVGRIEEVPQTVFLADMLSTKAAFLSHGQKQWLEIGMSLIQKPELLMLDEPVAGMSVAEGKKTAELLHSIIEDRAVLVVEHDINSVKDIAHKVTVLCQGKILSEGANGQSTIGPKSH